MGDATRLGGDLSVLVHGAAWQGPAQHVLGCWYHVCCQAARCPHAAWGWHSASLGPRDLSDGIARTCARSPGRWPMPPSVIPMSVSMRVPGVLRILSLRAALRHEGANEVWPSWSVAHDTQTAMLCVRLQGCQLSGHALAMDGPGGPLAAAHDYVICAAYHLEYLR